MPWQRRRPDPSSRPDPYELAVARGPQGGPEEPDGTPPLSRLRAGPLTITPRGLLVTVLALVLVGALVRFQTPGGPVLEASCTTPALALSTDRVVPGGLVRWTAVGPAGVPVRLEVAGQRVPGQVLQDCRAEGSFGVQAPPGEHEVLLVRTDRPAPPLARETVTVTELGDPSAG